jgi:serine O-acetyltransferase
VVIEDVIYNMQKQVAIAFRHGEEYQNASDETLTCGARCITQEFFKKIPHIRALIDTDLQATYDGDPAAFSKEEIILSYPGLYATAINRMAHELYLLKVPLIPRIMTEYAHSKTGIDIHPGATIGKYFMIDHGTGIVIGETSIIGEHVKVYQGVTIGALSTRGGQALKGAKRHPTIEDNVTIYAGASILGGETVIGHDSVVGSNAFLTTSIAPGTRVSIKNQELQFNNGSAKDF